MHSILLTYLLTIAAGLANGSSTTKELPCSELTNECVGKWFADKYGCKALESPDSSLATFTGDDNFAIPTPGFNLTYYRSNWTMTGIDLGVIQSFFIEDGKTVLTLSWDEISFGGMEFVTLHRQGELNFDITTPFFKVMYNVTTTTIIDGEDVMTNTNLDSILFPLEYFPTIVEVAAENEYVNERVEYLAARLPLLALEEGFYMGPVFANAYIQNAICAKSEGNILTALLSWIV